MRILFATPGHLKTVPMGKFCADALSDLGHEVYVFDYRATLRDKVQDRFAKVVGAGLEAKQATNKRLRKVIAAYQPDLFLTLFGFDVSVESLAHLRHEGIPSACWWINDPFQLARSLKKAAHYDYIFSNSAGCLEDYRAAGAANAFFLPTACDPKVHRPVPPQQKYRCDVCFAGDWSPLREQIMDALAQDFDVRIFGPWGKKISADSKLHAHLTDGFFTPDEMACMFSSAKVVLNVHTWYGSFDHGVNPRLFEAAGCGAFQLVDWKQEIPDLFDCEKEVRCYRVPQELNAMVREVLGDDAARLSAAQAAHARAYREHTYRHRMERLLQIVEQGTAAVGAAKPT